MMEETMFIDESLKLKSFVKSYRFHLTQSAHTFLTILTF